MSHTKPSRRDFLKTTGAVAGAAAVPYIFSSSQAKALAPSDKPSIALIGCGGQGSGDARRAGGQGQLVACCDVDRNRAEKFSGGKLEIFDDYRKLLDKKGIDIIVCGTPDHWHTRVNLAAIRSGHDVYGEKPLTLTIDEGKLICKAVKENKTVFQVGTQQRSGRQFQEAAAYARSGRLGTPVTATCYIGSGPKGGPFKESDVPKGLNWDFWLGQTPMTPYIKERCHYQFRWWLEYSGGKLTDWGAHHVDIAHWGLGEEHTGPVEMEGEGVFDERPDCYNTAQTFKCTGKFADGNKIVVTHGPGNGIMFEGPKGHIFVNRGRGPKGKAFEEMTDKDKEWLQGEVDKLYAGNKSGGHMGNFFNCVKDRKDPISDVYTHHRAVSTCHMCNIAMKLKRKLKWDPVKEDFVGDKEASAMRTREQRKGYEIS